MRWYEATLIKPKATGVNRLGVETYDEAPSGTCVVRRLPYHGDPIATEGNRTTAVRRVFVTPAPPEELRGVTKIVVGGREYRIENLSNLANGHSILTVADYKQEGGRHGVLPDCGGIPSP